MLNEVKILNTKQAILLYTDGTTFSLYSSQGNVVQMVDEFLAPVYGQCETYSSYLRSLDDTAVVNLADLNEDFKQVA